MRLAISRTAAVLVAALAVAACGSQRAAPPVTTHAMPPAAGQNGPAAFITRARQVTALWERSAAARAWQAGLVLLDASDLTPVPRDQGFSSQRAKDAFGSGHFRLAATLPAQPARADPARGPGHAGGQRPDGDLGGRPHPDPRLQRLCVRRGVGRLPLREQRHGSGRLVAAALRGQHALPSRGHAPHRPRDPRPPARHPGGPGRRIRPAAGPGIPHTLTARPGQAQAGAGRFRVQLSTTTLAGGVTPFSTAELSRTEIEHSWERGHGAERGRDPRNRRAPSSSCRRSCASRPGDG